MALWSSSLTAQLRPPPCPLHLEHAGTFPTAGLSPSCSLCLKGSRPGLCSLPSPTCSGPVLPTTSQKSHPYSNPTPPASPVLLSWHFSLWNKYHMFISWPLLPTSPTRHELRERVSRTARFLGQGMAHGRCSITSCGLSKRKIERIKGLEVCK